MRSAYRYQVLLLLCALSIITYLDRICIAVAGPRMQVDLGIGPAQWGWIGSAFTLSYGAFEIPSGHWGDRIGPRRVLTRVILWWSAFTALTGLASQFWPLLIVRFCFGAGEAGAYPNGAVAISRWFGKSEQTRALGWLVMCSQLGGALTPFLVVPLQSAFGWRAAFFLLGALGLPWAWVWWRTYRDEPTFRETGDPIEQPSSDYQMAQRADWKLKGKSRWDGIARSWNLWKLVLIAGSYGYGMYFYAFWLHTYLVRARGFSERALLFTTGPFLLGACTNIAGGYVSDYLAIRFGPGSSRRFVGFVGLGSAALFTLLAIVMSNRYAALACLALAYGGMAFQQPNVWAVSVHMGGQRAGAVSGFMNTGWNVGGFLSSLVFGYLVQWTGSFNVPLYAIAVVLALGAVLWLRIDPQLQLRTQTASPSTP